MQTSTNEKKLILVTGGTGAQGGSVARALMKQNNYRVRILTRDPNSRKAQILQRAGAEVIKGDLADKQSLINAVKGVYGVFGITNYFEHYEKEVDLGINLIDAVRNSGTEHFVLQTLESYYHLSHGRYAVQHYDGKAKLEQYARNLAIPSTFIQPAFFYENFLRFFPLQRDNKGAYYFGFPQGDTKLAMTSVEDVGKIVSAVFEDPAEYIGRTVGIVGSDDSPHQYASTLTRVLGKNVYYNYIPRNIYAAYDFRGAEELANMFEVQRLYIPSRSEEMKESYAINPSMISFENWVAKNKDKFIAYFNTLFQAKVI